MAAFLFDPQFWLTPKILSSVIGVALLLMGITGGDFSVSSVRIPKIEGSWRAISAVGSVIFLLFGFGLLDGALKSASADTVAAPTGAGKPVASGSRPATTAGRIGSTGTVEISISDSLGNDQLWETVDVTLGDSPAQRLSVTKDHRRSTVAFRVPSTGELPYRIDQVQARSADGQTVRDSGTGTLSAGSSRSYVVDGGVFNGEHKVFLRPSTH